MYKFAIGQKVACIGLPAPGVAVCTKYGIATPVKGGIYTVRGRGYFPEDAALAKSAERYCGVGYVFEELVNPVNAWSFTHGEKIELHFDEVFFRPLKDTSKEVENLIRLGDPNKWTQEDRERFIRGAVKPRYVREKEKV